MRNQQNTTQHHSCKQLVASYLVYSWNVATAAVVAYIHNYQCSFSFSVFFFLSYIVFILIVKIKLKEPVEWATTKLHVSWCCFGMPSNSSTDQMRTEWTREREKEKKTTHTNYPTDSNLNEQKQKQETKKKKLNRQILFERKKKHNNEEPNERNM